MNIKFKKWVDAGHFSLDAKHLLESSIVCYKSETYTAALLMGYLGFLIILKERLMAANKPSLFPDRDWDLIIRNLQHEDKWEEALLNALMTQERKDATGRTRDPIFMINDNLRTQIKFWKDRRNDCVHHKDNAILSSHVEAFWSFLESNLQKITIEGGKAALINKFARHYDISYTPEGQDVSPLLKEIKGAVEKLEMPDFWNQIFEIISNLFDYSEEAYVIRKIIEIHDAIMIDSLLLHIKGNETLLRGCVGEYPELLNYLGYDSQEIRKFWKTKITRIHNVMGVLASMFRNNLIPDDQIKDAMHHVVKVLKYNDNINDHYVLQAKGFGEVLYDKLFVENSNKQLKYWDFMNNNYMLYIKYIKYYELKDEVVKILCEEMAKTSWNAKFLQQALNQFFKENSNKKQEFIEKAATLGFALPLPIEELLV